jgi:hypothetical protein
MHNCSVGFPVLDVCRSFVAFCNKMWLSYVCAAHKLALASKKWRGKSCPSIPKLMLLAGVADFSALDSADLYRAFRHLVIGC